MPLEYDRHRIIEVSAKLQPGTSTKVTVTATLTSTEVPYSAKLVSVFEDGKTKRRHVDGHYQEKVLKQIKVGHSAPHFTKSGKPAPTTTTTTTTTT